MKVPIPEFSLVETVSNILAKRLRVAKERDHKIEGRIVKMQGRGWDIPGPEDDVQVRYRLDWCNCRVTLPGAAC